jgi:hypothetical protein
MNLKKIVCTSALSVAFLVSNSSAHSNCTCTTQTDDASNTTYEVTVQITENSTEAAKIAQAAVDAILTENPGILDSQPLDSVNVEEVKEIIHNSSEAEDVKTAACSALDDASSLN